MIQLKLIVVARLERRNSLNQLIRLLEGDPGIEILSVIPPRLYQKQTEVNILNLKITLADFVSIAAIFQTIKNILKKMYGQVRDFDEGLRDSDMRSLMEVSAEAPTLNPLLIKEIYFNFDEIYRLETPPRILAEIMTLVCSTIKAAKKVDLDRVIVKYQNIRHPLKNESDPRPSSSSPTPAKKKNGQVPEGPADIDIYFTRVSADAALLPDPHPQEGYRRSPLDEITRIKHQRARPDHQEGIDHRCLGARPRRGVLEPGTAMFALKSPYPVAPCARSRRVHRRPAPRRPAPPGPPGGDRLGQDLHHGAHHRRVECAHPGPVPQQRPWPPSVRVEFKGFFPAGHVGCSSAITTVTEPEAFIPRATCRIAKRSPSTPGWSGCASTPRATCWSPGNDKWSPRSRPSTASAPPTISANSDCCWPWRPPGPGRAARRRARATGRPAAATGCWPAAEFPRTGAVVEIFPTSEEDPLRFVLDNRLIERIEPFDALTAAALGEKKQAGVYPINFFFHRRERVLQAATRIAVELEERLAWLRAQGQDELAERLRQRTRFDLEMIENMGYCNGIENYSRHMDGRMPGEPPWVLFDYFPEDFLLIIDESHIRCRRSGACISATGRASRRWLISAFACRRLWTTGPSCSRNLKKK